VKANIHFKRYVRNDLLQCKEFLFCSNRDIYWLLNNQFHREDGPAFEIDSGIKKEWWLNGAWYSKEKHRQALEEYKKNKT